MATASPTVLDGVKSLAIDGFGCCFPAPEDFDPSGSMLATLTRLGIKHDTEAALRIYKTLEHLLYRGMIPTNQMFWQLVLCHLEITSTRELIDELAQAELRHYNFPGIALYDGVSEFMKWARSGSFRTILWSNATWTGWETEMSLGLPELFVGRAISCLNNYVKNPRSGEKSLLGWTVEHFRIRIPSEELVVVDDQLAHLRRAQRELDCRTVLVCNGRPAPTFNEGDFRPTLIVDRLADLQGHLPSRAVR